MKFPTPKTADHKCKVFTFSRQAKSIASIKIVTKFSSALMLLGLFLLSIMLSGCSSGPMYVHEVHYFQISNGTNANYFRLTVDAHSQLGVAEYRSGWFPTRSVDSLFGDVSSTSGTYALEMRANLEGLINTNVFLTTKAWLDEASKTNANPSTLTNLTLARQRVLQYPSAAPMPNFVDIDYNPISGLVTSHADEKMVFVMASNPDEVIGKIANFTESDKTSLSVQHLAGVIKQKDLDGFYAQLGAIGVSEKNDGILYGAMTNVIQSTSNYSTTANDALVSINSLINLIDALKQ